MARRREADDLDDDGSDRERGVKRSGPVPVWVWLLAGGVVLFLMAGVGVGALALVVWSQVKSEKTEVAGSATNSTNASTAPPSTNQFAGRPAKGQSNPKSPTTPDPDAELKRNAQDLKEYVDKLKRAVPYDMKKFTDAGYKAESYKKDPKREWFTEVVLKVDPVYLTDNITGETKKYTRARMVRNNPPPTTFNSRGGVTSVPVPFEWESITMLP